MVLGAMTTYLYLDLLATQQRLVGIDELWVDWGGISVRRRHEPVARPQLADVTTCFIDNERPSSFDSLGVPHS